MSGQGTRWSSAQYDAWLAKREGKAAIAETKAALPPAPVTMPRASEYEAMAERTIQNEIEQWLRLHGIEFMRAPMHKANSLPIGFPDFELFLPWGRAGFIEVKTETGRLSPEQVAYHARLTERGFHVFVCRSLVEAMATVREMEGRR